MTTESWLWGKLKKTLQPEAEMTRHEERGRQGIPDVSFGLRKMNGWIELKAYDEWPSDPAVLVGFDNFKVPQRRWLKRRGESGGRCFVMVLIGIDILLFDWTSIRLMGKSNQRSLRRLAVGSWKSTDKKLSGLAELLTGQPD